MCYIRGQAEKKPARYHALWAEVGLQCCGCPCVPISDRCGEIIDAYLTRSRSVLGHVSHLVAEPAQQACLLACQGVSSLQQLSAHLIMASLPRVSGEANSLTGEGHCPVVIVLYPLCGKE